MGGGPPSPLFFNITSPLLVERGHGNVAQPCSLLAHITQDTLCNFLPVRQQAGFNTPGTKEKIITIIYLKEVGEEARGVKEG